MLFTARRLQDNYEEQTVDLHIAFVDLTKRAKQLVMMDLKIIVKLGCIAMVRQLHDGMQASVQND